MEGSHTFSGQKFKTFAGPDFEIQELFKVYGNLLQPKQKVCVETHVLGIQIVQALSNKIYQP